MSVLDMLTDSFVVRLRLLVYLVLLFFSFFIFIGVAVFKDKRGCCPLYSDLYCGSASNCNYPMAVAIIFQLIYGLYRIVTLVLFVLGKFTTEMFLFSNILELVYLIIDALGFILVFIAACILSAGHNDSLYLKHSDAMDASNVSQAGAWISSFLWLFISVVGTLYILRTGKLPFGGSSGTTNTGTTGHTSSGPQPVDTPPNYDTPKY